MKISHFKYFYQENFLDQDLHESMLDPINQCMDLIFAIDNQGLLSYPNIDHIENRYHNNSILKDNVPESTKALIELLENKLKLEGLEVPTIYNLALLSNPTVDPFYDASFEWHRDYNPIKHITDPNKLWFTMLSLSRHEVDSEFMISPSPEGPEFWNHGVRTTVSTNKLFGHNINMGHQYIPKTKNQLGFLYIRWYDAG